MPLLSPASYYSWVSTVTVTLGSRIFVQLDSLIFHQYYPMLKGYIFFMWLDTITGHEVVIYLNGQSCFEWVWFKAFSGHSYARQLTEMEHTWNMSLCWCRLARVQLPTCQHIAITRSLCGYESRICVKTTRNSAIRNSSTRDTAGKWYG